MDNIAYSIQRHRKSSAAIDIDGHIWTYGELTSCAGALSRAIRSCSPAAHGAVAILSSKSFFAYGAIVGAHGAGRGYVPLNPQFPLDRLSVMIERSNADVLMVAADQTAIAIELMKRSNCKLAVIAEHSEQLREFRNAGGSHIIEAVGGWGEEPSEIMNDDAIAYILFTSGSTGQPKGVPVSIGNLGSYLKTAETLFPVLRSDRCSQAFDLTFDLSVHDIFTTFRAGACLVPLSKNDSVGAAKFIRDKGLTIWFSVPTMAALMDRTRTLRPGIFPSLRRTLFCGEALPATIASKWAKCAPNSEIYNLYGPTEATIAIAFYKFDPSESILPNEKVVPIGTIFSGQRHLITDMNELVPLEKGELLLSGDQVTDGYLLDPEKTAEQFVSLNDYETEVWYRTGDLVRRGGDNLLHYLGRIDSQIKFRGHRIELQEIDGAIRKASQSEFAVAVPVDDEGTVAKIVAVISNSDLTENQILSECRNLLPEYMVPEKVVLIPEMPTNSNGKIDRKAAARKALNP